jgi:hypothetical protein
MMSQGHRLGLHVSRGARAVTVLALTGELTGRTIGRLQAVLSPLVSAPAPSCSTWAGCTAWTPSGWAR